MNALLTIGIGSIALAVGTIIGAAIGLGRQDDLMHALAHLLEDPTDKERIDHARKTLLG